MNQAELFARMIDPRNRMTGHEQTTETHHFPPDWQDIKAESENTKGIKLNTIHPNKGWFNLEFTFDEITETVVHHYPVTPAGYLQAKKDIEEFQTV